MVTEIRKISYLSAILVKAPSISISLLVVHLPMLLTLCYTRAEDDMLR